MSSKKRSNQSIFYNSWNVWLNSDIIVSESRIFNLNAWYISTFWELHFLWIDVSHFSFTSNYSDFAFESWIKKKSLYSKISKNGLIYARFGWSPFFSYFEMVCLWKIDFTFLNSSIASTCMNDVDIFSAFSAPPSIAVTTSPRKSKLFMDVPFWIWSANSPQNTNTYLLNWWAITVRPKK